MAKNGLSENWQSSQSPELGEAKAVARPPGRARFVPISEDSDPAEALKRGGVRETRTGSERRSD